MTKRNFNQCPDHTVAWTPASAPCPACEAARVVKLFVDRMAVLESQVRSLQMSAPRGIPE